MSSKNKDYKLGSGSNSEFLRPNFKKKKKDLIYL